MENASSALIIAGAILLSILIIAIGIYIFNSAQGTIDSSLQSMTSQEVDAFNSQFTSYQGDDVSGSNVKALMTKLAANYGSYKDEPSKVPSVLIVNNTVDSAVTNLVYDSIPTGNATDTAYTSGVSKIRNAIINKHTYKVMMEFGAAGIIETITIEDVTK